MLNIQTIDRQRWVKFFTHLIVIVMIFFLPDMLMTYGSHHRHPMMERLMYYKALAFVAVFYINYYLIIKRTLFGRRPKFLSFIAWNLLLIIAFIVFFYYLGQWIWDLPQMRDRRAHELPRSVLILRQWSYILRDVGMIVLTVALSAALRFAERWASLEKRHEQLMASQKEEELENLKNQLNPHFLFNTLNTIYSLIDIDPKEAQLAIHQLSKLLRHVLYENPTKVPLSEEVDFIRTYISLMEMRLGAGRVVADFSNIVDDQIEVAPLLFISLIENAFKHGNTGIKENKIEITISSDADGRIVCKTFNHFVATPTHREKKGSGIGLVNLKRRMQLIYGKQATLATYIEGDTYTAILTINPNN